MAGKNTNTSSLARVPPNADADAASATNTPAAIAAVRLVFQSQQ